MKRVGVVGAGLSGLVSATLLRRRGHRVRVFDKARGVGGRMSTRRTENGSFDHGAQYFTVRDDRFARAVESWRRAGVVARWNGTIVSLEAGEIGEDKGGIARWVGVPGMNAVCRHLAADLDVALETRVAGFVLEDGSWHLPATGDRDLGRYDALVVSAPAPPRADLLAGVAPALARAAARAPMAPCWAVMVSFSGPLDLAFDGAFVHGSPLSWVARNSSKPAREGLEAWVLHASPEWSRDNLELGPAAVTKILFEAFGQAVGGLAATPADRQAHRWRFALPTEPLPDPCLYDPDLRLAVCGDWCGGPRVEGAFLSGCAAAEALLRSSAGTEDPSAPVW